MSSAPNTSGLTPGRKAFNWADDDDSSSSDGEVMPTTSPSLVAADQPHPATPSRGTAAAASDTTPTAHTATAADDDAAVRELLLAITPSRQSQEVTIQAAIPYKLKSVWNAGGTSPAPSTPSVAAGPSSAAPTPARVAAAGGPSPSSAASKAATPSGAAAGAASRPLRMNRAVDELTSVLRANDGSLPYDELMASSQWRSRFQPSFGSLFTFLKRNRDIFHYQQSVVELVKEGSIVAELLKMQWGATSAVEVNSRICGYTSAAAPAVGVTVGLSPSAGRHGEIGSKEASPASGH